MVEKVGILGLGLIGRTAAELIMSHGYKCYAVRRPSTLDFPKIGGELVDTPRELAEVCDILLCTLPTEVACREAFHGDDGVTAGAHDGQVIIEMGTFPLALKQELKSAIDNTSAVMVDCPISGTPPMLQAGKGVIMMSGDVIATERVKPMLEFVAPKTFYVGEYGNGIKLKLMINFMVTANTVALAEGMLFGAAMGLDNQTMLDVVSPSAAGSTVFGMRAGIIAERKWQPCAGPSKILWKDIDIVVEQAEVLGLSAPIARICDRYYKKIAAADRLEDECAVVYEFLEEETKNSAG